MTKLWPVEVFRKFQVQKQFKFEFRIQIQPSRTGGKNSRHPQVDWGVDLGVDLGVDTPQVVSTAQSTPLSTWVVGQFGLGAPDLFLKTCLEVCDKF